MVLEPGRRLVVDRHAGHVGGEQVGRELDPSPLTVHARRDGPRDGRLADAGDILQEQVPLGEQGGQREAYHLGLAEHHGLDVGGEPGQVRPLQLGRHFTHSPPPWNVAMIVRVR